MQRGYMMRRVVVRRDVLHQLIQLCRQQVLLEEAQNSFSVLNLQVRVLAWNTLLRRTVFELIIVRKRR